MILNIPFYNTYMKYLLIISLIFPTTVFAKLEASAYEKYSTTNTMTTTTKITWETVDDPQKVCTEIKVKLTGKPYGYKIDACSEWSRNYFNQFTCRIITGKTTNNDIVGHEVRHCFQGNFHP